MEVLIRVMAAAAAVVVAIAVLRSHLHLPALSPAFWFVCTRWFAFVFAFTSRPSRQPPFRMRRSSQVHVRRLSSLASRFARTGWFAFAFAAAGCAAAAAAVVVPRARLSPPHSLILPAAHIRALRCSLLLPGARSCSPVSVCCCPLTGARLCSIGPCAWLLLSASVWLCSRVILVVRTHYYLFLSHSVF
jgi:hypothetical protein